MRDYAELVKALKNCAPTYANETNLKYIGLDTLLDDAADAIEELLVKAGLWHRRYQLEREKVEKLRSAAPKWISVEERLPERYETVLLNIQTCKDSYVTIGDYEPNELRFRDFADRNNHVYCGDIVTHWMPLPAPPTEKGVE